MYAPRYVIMYIYTYVCYKDSLVHHSCYEINNLLNFWVEQLLLGIIINNNSIKHTISQREKDTRGSITF